MYIATFIYWVTFLATQFQTLRAIMGHLFGAYGWLGGLTENLVSPSECFPGSPLGDLPEYCTTLSSPGTNPPRDGWFITQGDCIGTATLTFNVSLGDAIVWWRVWVLWNKNRLVLACCCVVLVSTLACGIADSFFSCDSSLIIWDDLASGVSANTTEGGAFFGGNTLGLTTIVLSLFSNALATSLVGFKAWRHRLRAQKHFARVPGVIRVQRTLMLLVESGIAYCLLWALVLSSSISWMNSPPIELIWTTGQQTWTTYMLYFTEGCLVAFVGIYPTLIIVLVALNKSEIEKQTLVYSIPVARALQPSPVQVEVTTDVVCAADTGARGGTRPQSSVILIGPPLPPDRSSTILSDVTSEDDVELSKIASCGVSAGNDV